MPALLPGAERKPLRFSKPEPSPDPLAACAGVRGGGDTDGGADG